MEAERRTATPNSHSGPMLARPGRPAVVAPDLAELAGPTSGRVELPNRLLWSGVTRELDLDKPDMLRWMYEIVLCEAVTVTELKTWLHGPTLVRVWPELYVPRGVRRAWESRHPQLRRDAA